MALRRCVYNTISDSLVSQYPLTVHFPPAALGTPSWRLVTRVLTLVANSQNPYSFVEVSRINLGVLDNSLPVSVLGLGQIQDVQMALTETDGEPTSLTPVRR